MDPLKMYVLLKMGIFQPAMLAYQRVMAGDPRHLSPIAAQRTWRYWNVESPADLEVLAPPETKNGFSEEPFLEGAGTWKTTISYRYMYKWCHEQLVWRKWDVIFHPGSRSYF